MLINVNAMKSNHDLEKASQKQKAGTNQKANDRAPQSHPQPHSQPKPVAIPIPTQVFYRSAARPNQIIRPYRPQHQHPAMIPAPILQMPLQTQTGQHPALLQQQTQGLMQMLGMPNPNPPSVVYMNPNYPLVNQFQPPQPNPFLVAPAHPRVPNSTQRPRPHQLQRSVQYTLDKTRVRILLFHYK